MSYLIPPTIPGSLNVDTTYSRVIQCVELTDGTAILKNGYLSNLNNPINPTDVATKEYVLDHASGNPGSNNTWKTAVKVATTTNIAYPFIGISTIDDVLLQVDDRVLVKNQLDTTQNGIWLVSLTTWSRAIDCAEGVQASGLGIIVSAGSANANIVYLCNTTGPAPFYAPVHFGEAITFIVYGQSTAGGSDTQIQYNNSGTLAGNPNFTFTGTAVNLNSGTSLTTNLIKSNNTVSDANIFTSHNSAINIGSLTNTDLSLRMSGNGGSLIIDKQDSVAMGNIELLGSDSSGPGIASSNIILTPGLSGYVSINNTTASTSTTTGALVVNGGTGINGNLNVNGTLTAGFINSSVGTINTLVVDTLNPINLSVTNSTINNLLVTSSLVFPLASTKILVGNSSNQAAAVSMSGDATINNTGTVTLATVNSNSGSSTLSTVTTNLKGLVISNSSATLASTNFWIGNSSAIPTAVSMSGDATMSNTGSFILATVNSPNTSTLSTVVTNSKGLITSNTTASLNSANMWVGNTSNVPTAVSMSGDATMSNIGVVSLANVNTNSGTSTLSTIVTNAKGLVTANSSATLASTNIWIGNASSVPTAVAISGDITMSNTGAVTLATVNSGPGTSTLSAITTNAKGLVTNNASAALASTNIWVGNASSVPTAVAMSGDAVLSNTGSFNLATVNSNPGTSTLSTVTTTAKGLVTSNTSATLASANIWVGNSSNVPTAVVMSGDAVLSNTGAVSLANVNANFGTSTLSTIVTNSKGLVTANSSATLASSSFWIGNSSNVPTAVSMSGDATLANTGAVTLATVNANSRTSILSTVTTNAKGLVTSNTSAALASANIWVGNASSVPTAVSMSGDATMANTGAVTLATVNNNSGTSTLSTIITNSKGLVTANSSATLASTNFWVGNASSVPTAVSMSGDATMSNTGAVTLATVNSSPATTTLTTIVKNSKGLVTSSSSAGLASANFWVGNASSVPTAVTMSGGATMSNTGLVSISNAALTASNDTNVTLTLGGSPTTALLNAASITPSWTGFLSGERGGLAANNTGKTITLGGSLTTAGAFDAIFNMTDITNVTFPTSGTLAVEGQTVTPAALTAVNDTNVTLTLGGSPTGSILQATSITAGWAGQMSVSRGGTGLSSINANNIIYASATGVLSTLSGTSGVLVTSSTGVPSIAQMTNGQIIIGNTSGTPTPGLITSTTGIQVTAGAGTLALSLPSSITGNNMLYNGSFQVAQRGTSFTVGTGYNYTLDRWVAWSGSSSVWTVSQVQGPTSGSYAIRIKRTTGSSSTASVGIYQSLTRDMSSGMQNSLLTLSMTVTVGANFSNIISIIGKTSTSTTDIAYQNYSGLSFPFADGITPTTTRTRYTITSTLVDSNATQIGLVISYTPTGTAGANDYVDIENIQLELGPVATNYQYISYAEELLRCKYFYQNITGVGGYSNVPTGVEFSANYMPMRIVPTITCPTVMSVSDGTTTTTQSSFSITNNITNVNGGFFRLNNFSGLTALRPYTIYSGSGFTNSYLMLSSELV